ncbi:MAG: tetratricopeptide repeat protein [Pyrinomonadaceae bacterium]
MEPNNQLDLLMRNGKYQDIIELLEKGSFNTEEDWRLLWHLGWSYYQLEQLDEARQQFSKALRLSPENPLCKLLLGAVHLDKKEFEKAEFVLSEALRKKKGYTFRLCLTLAFMGQGKIEDAEKIHLEAIKLKPNDCERLEAYGDFLSDVGREDEWMKRRLN